MILPYDVIVLKRAVLENACYDGRDLFSTFGKALVETLTDCSLSARAINEDSQ